MPTETVDMKAARLLKNNAVKFIAAARVYEVKVGTNQIREVTVREDGKIQWWMCNCEFGQHNSPMHDVDRICYHVAAVILMDADIMAKIEQRMDNN